MKLYYIPSASSLLVHIVRVEGGQSFDAIGVDELTCCVFGARNQYCLDWSQDPAMRRRGVSAL